MAGFYVVSVIMLAAAIPQLTGVWASTGFWRALCGTLKGTIVGGKAKLERIAGDKFKLNPWPDVAYDADCGAKKVSKCSFMSQVTYPDVDDGYYGKGNQRYGLTDRDGNGHQCYTRCLDFTGINVYCD